MVETQPTTRLQFIFKDIQRSRRRFLSLILESRSYSIIEFKRLQHTMISSDSQGGPNIAVITIACGWTFAGIASLGVGLLIWSRRVRKLALGLDDYLTFLALATTIALVVQTTWAIVAEGLDNHEAEVKRTKFAWVVRVGLFSPLPRGSDVDMIESRSSSIRLYGAW